MGTSRVVSVGGKTAGNRTPSEMLVLGVRILFYFQFGSLLIVSSSIGIAEWQCSGQ